MKRQFPFEEENDQPNTSTISLSAPSVPSPAKPATPQKDIALPKTLLPSSSQQSSSAPRVKKYVAPSDSGIQAPLSKSSTIDNSKSIQPRESTSQYYIHPSFNASNSTNSTNTTNSLNTMNATNATNSTNSTNATSLPMKRSSFDQPPSVKVAKTMEKSSSSSSAESSTNMLYDFSTKKSTYHSLLSNHLKSVAGPADASRLFERIVELEKEKSSSKESTENVESNGTFLQSSSDEVVLSHLRRELEIKNASLEILQIRLREALSSSTATASSAHVVSTSTDAVSKDDERQKKEIVTLKHHVAFVESAQKVLKSEYDDLFHQNKEMQDQIKMLSGEKRVQEQLNIEQAEKVKFLKNRADQLSGRVDALKDNIDIERKEKHKLRCEIDALKADASKSDSKSRDASDYYKGEMKKLNESNSLLLDSNSSLYNEISEVKKNLRVIELDKSALSAKLSDLGSTNQALIAERDSCLAEMNQVKSEKFGLMSEIDRLKRLLESSSSSAVATVVVESAKDTKNNLEVIQLEEQAKSAMIDTRVKLMLARQQLMAAGIDISLIESQLPLDNAAILNIKRESMMKD